MVGVGDRPAPEAGQEDDPGLPVGAAAARAAEACGAGPVRAVRAVLPSDDGERHHSQGSPARARPGYLLPQHRCPHDDSDISQRSGRVSNGGGAGRRFLGAIRAS